MPSRSSEGVFVQVRSHYLEEHSDPSEPRYVFVYEVRIQNEGADAAQLISRHWVITDASAGVEEVRGAGVIGEQPRIRAGGTHAYQSFCVLKTPGGSMRGSYQMLRDDGRSFEVEISPFELSPTGVTDSMLN